MGVKGQLGISELQFNGKADQVLVVAEEEWKLESMVSDGIAGLGFKEGCMGYDTLVTSLVKSGIIEKSCFSLYFGDNGYGTKKEKIKSSILFGGHELKKYSNKKFEFLNVIHPSLWGVKLTGLKVNEKSVKTTSEIGIFDSGINLIIGPRSEFLEIFYKIQRKLSCVLSTLIICKCRDYDEFPILDFYFENKNFPLNPEEYVVKDKDSCYVLLLGLNIDFWLIGNPFLRSYYSFYDMDSRKVALARSSTASHKRSSKGDDFVPAILGILLVCTLGCLGIFLVIYLRKKKQPVINYQEIMIPLEVLNK